MALSRRPDRRPPAPVRGWISLTVIVAMFGYVAWRAFASGHPAFGWWVVGCYFACPAAALLWSRRSNRRRAGRPPEFDPGRGRRQAALVCLWFTATMGSLEIMTTTPGHRIVAGVITAVVLLACATLAWRNRRP